MIRQNGPTSLKNSKLHDLDITCGSHREDDLSRHALRLREEDAKQYKACSYNTEPTEVLSVKTCSH